MRPIAGLAAALLAAAALVACQKKSDSAIAVDERSVPTQVARADLHPCAVTSSELTLEDCAAAELTMAQARKGVAAFNAPSWMVQGMSQTVTLAVGSKPDTTTQVPGPAETVDVQHQRSVSDKSVVTGTGSPPATPNSGIEPEVAKTPHDVAEAAKANKRDRVIDYHPYVGRKMAADLLGDGFAITPITMRVQEVGEDSLTLWQWKVRATDYGRKTLIMRSSVIMIDSQNHDNVLKPTTATRTVNVWIGPPSIWEALKNAPLWLKAIAALITALGIVLTAWRKLRRSLSGEPVRH